MYLQNPDIEKKIVFFLVENDYVFVQYKNRNDMMFMFINQELAFLFFYIDMSDV